MKIETTYSNAEVVDTLLKYHAGRVPYDPLRFKVWPCLRLESDGSWIVVVEELPPPPVRGKWWSRWIAVGVEWINRRWGYAM